MDALPPKTVSPNALLPLLLKDNETESPDKALSLSNNETENSVKLVIQRLKLVGLGILG